MEQFYSPIKIMIADDHQIYREGVEGLFRKQADIEVVGNYSNGKELLDGAAENIPDVVLTDIKMPVMDGIQTAAMLRNRHPHVKVIALSMFNDDHLVIDMVEAGAKGYLLKNAHKNDILDAIRAVYRGEAYFCRETSDKLIRLMAKSKATLFSDEQPVKFTNKEFDIIQHICNGLLNKDISELMHLSIRTIEGYRERIHSKMKVKNTAGIVVYAIKHGMYKI